MKIVPVDLGKYQWAVVGLVVLVALLLMGQIQVSVPEDWWIYAALLLGAFLYLSRKKESKEITNIHDLTIKISDDMKYRPPGHILEWDRPVVLKLGKRWIVQPSVNEPTIVADSFGNILETADIDPIKFLRMKEGSELASGELKDEIKIKIQRDKLKEEGYDLQESNENEEDDEE